MEFYPGFEQEAKRKYKKRNTMAIAITLTDLELQALRAITESDFYENGRDSVPWDFSVYDCCPFTGKKRSGVFSSLVQKGLVAITPKEKKWLVAADGSRKINQFYSPDNYGTIYITEAGYQLLDEMRLIDVYGRFIN